MELYVFVYLDDVIIVTETFVEHLEWLKKVFDGIKNANIKLSPEKCEFCCTQVRYLGYLVNEDGLQPDPKKIEPVVNYPVPRTVKQLRRFLGMAS